MQTQHPKDSRYLCFGKPLPQISSAKAAELLLILVEHRGHRILRTDLEQKLWPASSPPQAQQSLRQAIHQIGKAFGEQTPIVANRTHVFCRARDIYERATPRPQTPIHLPTHQKPTGVDWERLLVRFRTGKVESILDDLLDLSEADKANREVLVAQKVYVAFAQQELGLGRQGMRSALDARDLANTTYQKNAADHALGAILWHSGDYETGINLLWQVFERAEPFAQQRLHVATNIAVGAFEWRNREQFDYALSLVQREAGSEAESTLADVRHYLQAIESVWDRRHDAADQRINAALQSDSFQNNRLAVYLHELQADSYATQGNHPAAQAALKTAQTLRHHQAMIPSKVEATRLAKLQSRINSG